MKNKPLLGAPLMKPLIRSNEVRKSLIKAFYERKLKVDGRPKVGEEQKGNIFFTTFEHEKLKKPLKLAVKIRVQFRPLEPFRHFNITAHLKANTFVRTELNKVVMEEESKGIKTLYDTSFSKIAAATKDVMMTEKIENAETVFEALFEKNNLKDEEKKLVFEAFQQLMERIHKTYKRLVEKRSYKDGNGYVHPLMIYNGHAFYLHYDFERVVEFD